MGDGQIEQITTHVQDALNRRLYQYRAKPLFKAILTAVLQNVQTIENVMVSVPPSRILANAQGRELDLYGSLVNLPRNNNSDATYRRLIAGAIGEQNSDGTMPTLLFILSQVFATEALFTSDSSTPGCWGDPLTPHTVMQLGLGNPALDPAQFPTAIASFLGALPAAVNISSIWTFNAQRAFSMAGPQKWASAGFGDLSNPAVGGPFASLIFQGGDAGGLTDATATTGGSTLGAGTGGAVAGATTGTTGATTSTTPATGTGTTTGGTTGTTTGSGAATTGSTAGTGSGTTTGSGSAGSGSTAAETYTWIYQNSVQNQWTDYSYESANYSYEPDTRVAGGNARRATTGLAPYKAFNWGNLNGNSLPLNNYNGITLDMKCDSGTAHVRVQLDPGSNGSPTIYKEFDITPTWQSYKWYFTDANVVASGGTSFTNLEICNFVYPNVTTPPIDVNNVGLVINPSPPQPTYTLMPKDTSPANATGGWLYTKGANFYTPDNNPWWQPGINIPDTRMGGEAAEAYGNDPATVAITLKQHIQWFYSQGFRLFRMYLDQESNALGFENDVAYANATKDVVNYIGTLPGAYVEISLGVDNTCYPYPPNSGSGQPTIASLTRWSALATSFRLCGHVMFGLCNEPQGNDSDAAMAACMAIFNKCIDVIRQVEARDGAPNPHIIVCQGVNHYARHGQYFETYRCVDNYFPITDLVNGVGYLAYELHNYENSASWPAQPYNDGFPSRTPVFPYILGEFGFDYYAASDGSASYLGGPPNWNTSSTNDIPSFVDACEANKRPYCAWFGGTRVAPTLLVDLDPNGYGAGKGIQWNPTGLALINYIRQKRGIGPPVDSLGNPTS